MAYTSVGDVETYLRTTFTPTTIPTITQVEQYVDDVDEQVDQILGRSWGSQTYEEIIDVPYSTNKFLVKNYPLISVTSVEYNTAGEYDTPVWVAFEKYYTNGDFIITNTPITGNRKVRLTYTAGHITISPDVRMLATLLVVQQITTGDAVANSSTSSVSIGPLSITKNIGASRLLNLKTTIREQIKRIGKHKTVYS